MRHATDDPSGVLVGRVGAVDALARGRLRPFEAAFVDVNLVIDAVDAVQAVP
jgi:hypothetical protein